ncbi:HIT domain-containing protein [Patescibacteria group bacterium]|nr:HIT domain-containing protein [Patescibacteria group bacterium]
MVKKMKKVLFVCTGNVFRSMSAEYALKKYLKDKKISGWEVNSAGIKAKKEVIDPKTIEVLEELGIKDIKHHQKKLTKNLLKEHDVIIAMAKNHYDFIRSKFNYKNVVLFNELAINKKESVLDIQDEVKDYLNNRKDVEDKIKKTVRYILNKTPDLFKRISERFFLFSDFIEGSKKHRNGFPFMKLYETKNTVTFMSIDIPQKEDGHILIIPKKRYEGLSEIPPLILKELMGSVVKVGTAISNDHTGYNVLINNGVDAGQYIFHSHIHLIPRKEGDGINIEIWKGRKMNSKEFIDLNKKLKKQIYKNKIKT